MIILQALQDGILESILHHIYNLNFLTQNK